VLFTDATKPSLASSPLAAAVLGGVGGVLLQRETSVRRVSGLSKEGRDMPQEEEEREGDC